MKSIITKTFFVFIFACLFCKISVGQTYVTVITCDTTITNPSPLFNVGVDYQLTIRSANNTRIGFSVEYYNYDWGGDVLIYDGPDNTGTLLSHLTDYFNLPNQVWSAQSTATSITVAIHGVNIGDPTHFKIRARCVETPTATSVLQPMRALSAYGNIKAADYDGDGDKDLVIGGKVMRNDSYFDSLYKFERRPNLIDNWNHVNMCAADFDGDGYKDIFITGNSTVFNPLIGPRAAIYRNNGNNTFTLVTPQFFTGATRGGCCVFDYNNDGKPDICYTGSTDYNNNNVLIFKVYINNGNMNFTDANISLPGITGLINASMSWADSDNDGDVDLLVNGHNGSTNITRLYKRSGNTFTNQNLNMTPTSMGSLSWVDINNDGKPDIVNTGVQHPDNVDAIVPEIYMNNGNNNFTFTATNLPAYTFVSSDWSDYDNDNDKDIVMGGWLQPTPNGTDAGVFKNNGNGQFTRVSGLDSAVESTRLQWADINHDGKPDVIGGSYYIKNMGADSFKISSLSATTYENYPNNTVISDFNNDGEPDIFIAGEDMVDVDCNYQNTSTLVIGRGEKYSAIPKFTEVADVASLNPIVSSGFSPDLYYEWGDFDSDGLLDIIMTGDNYAGNASGFLVAYKNNGNNNFSLLYYTYATSFPQVPGGGWPVMRHVGLFDVDNDGVNELLLSPNIVYKNTGGQWLPYTYNLSNAGGGHYMDFADYNHDGFTDAVVSNDHESYVYRNDGAGNMVNITPIPSGLPVGSLGGGSERQVQWVDIDNDGDLDILTSSGILEYRADTFAYIINPILPSVHQAMGDFNNDGYKDLITVPRMDDYGPMRLYYGEQGTGFFYEHPMGTLTHPAFLNITYNDAVVAFDVDNDGDDDIVYSGGGSCALGAQVIINEGNFTDHSIHVIYPNGSESLIVNNTAVIKWYGNLLPATVNIEISRDSGITWQQVAANAPSTVSGGSYSWVVTGPASVKCLVRITGGTYSDKSNAVFTITTIFIPVANAGPDASICAGNSVQLGVPAVGTNQYSWTSSNGGFTSAVANPFVTPATTTSYFLTVTNGAYTAKDTVVINVISVNVSLPDTLINACTGNAYPIGISAQANTTYEWTSIPVGFNSNLANPVIIPVLPGDTSYYLVATNTTLGCIATTHVRIIADSCATTPGGGVVNIYPNPANNQLTVELDQNTVLPVFFKLMNANGLVVLNQSLTIASTIVNVSAYQTGTYYYTIRSTGGQVIASGIILIMH